MLVFVILAQIASIIGWLLLLYSYYKEDIDKLLFIQIISSIFYCISYLFLGAYSGFLVCFIELVKGIGYYKTDKDDLLFLISLPIYIAMAIFSYDTFYSLLPIVASIIDGFSLTKNKNIATIGSIISNVLWVIYDVIILAFASALTDGALVVSNISLLLFGYSMLIKSNKIRIVQCRNLSKNVYNAIFALDKDNYGVEYTWPLAYEKAVKNKNDKNLYLLKYDNNIVGYFNCLTINELEFQRIYESKDLINEYNIDNLVSLYKRKKNILLVDSINVKKKYHNQVTIDLITKKVKEIIIKNYENNYKIETMLGVAINQFEKDVLEHIGFTKLKDYSKTSALYELEKNKIESIYIKSPNNKKKYKIIEKDNITEELLKEINIIDKKFFKDEYTWSSDYQIELYNKNPLSMIMVTYDGKLIGYLNYLVISKEKYKEMIASDISIDSFTIDEVLNFSKTRNNYLTLNSVVILKKHQNGHAVKLLTKSLKKTLKKLIANNYKIAGINSIAISNDGMKFLTKLGFQEIKKLNDGNHLYELKDEKLSKYLR